MAGETIRSEAICLGIYPWSQTSHVVQWLTPAGRVSTVVKGAMRPKSFFLGQYDLNYTCEILYYARGKGEVHALREAVPLRLREALRADYRGLSLAGYARRLVGELAPVGGECAAWYGLLEETLDTLADGAAPLRTIKQSNNPTIKQSLVSGDSPQANLVRDLVAFELKVLKLAGILPDFGGYDRSSPWSAFAVETGCYTAEAGGRQVRVAREVAEFLANPAVCVKNPKIPLDAARVIGVFYQFHLDCALDVRRTVLRLIS